MKNKTKLILLIGLIVVIFIVILFFYKSNQYTFYINGENNISINYGLEYHDLGFVALNGWGKDISDNVIVHNDVNTTQSGLYSVTYELNYKNKKETLTRIVTVKEINIQDLEIVLNGDSEVNILLDSSYQEEGAYILNKVNQVKFKDQNIVISGDVDTHKIGNYVVSYQFNYNGGNLSATRNIKVFDINYKIEPNILTIQKVKIIFDLSNINDYTNIKLPNGNTLFSKNAEYEVSSNGEYSFIINTSNNQYIKKIKVDNIINNYVCNGEITNNGTTLKISPVENAVKEYEWVINGNIVKGSSTFNQFKIINNAKVNLVFQNGQKHTVNCAIKDNLIYHFKYDEKNTKPFMRCDTYTSQDKLALDAKLKAAVEKAGYGTRAGVVEAARFIVGALDYKVPYVGGSKYNKVGLNIGQNNAWGCSKVGLDCYYFIYWVLSQNGLPLDAIYGGKKYSSKSEVNNIRVGDYLYTPCTSSTCKNTYKINHIGLVIGVDDNYIYVAEDTTLDINALVVTKLSKKNMPASGNLSLVRHVSYPSEGNVTNMWLS